MFKYMLTYSTWYRQCWQCISLLAWQLWFNVYSNWWQSEYYM